MTHVLGDTPSLARLLFISKSTFPIGHATDDEIFREARLINQSESISGIILRGENWFCQTLEGAGPVIDKIWTRVRVDTRHRIVRHWWQTDSQVTLFANWRTEHWGISAEAQAVFLEVMQSNEISTSDKISMVRTFAHIRRAKSYRNLRTYPHKDNDGSHNDQKQDALTALATSMPVQAEDA